MQGRFSNVYTTHNCVIVHFENMIQLFKDHLLSSFPETGWEWPSQFLRSCVYLYQLLIKRWNKHEISVSNIVLIIFTVLFLIKKSTKDERIGFERDILQQILLVISIRKTIWLKKTWMLLTHAAVLHHFSMETQVQNSFLFVLLR
jgi:hypothetical protein